MDRISIIEFIEKYVVIKNADGTTSSMVLTDAGKAFLEEIEDGSIPYLQKYRKRTRIEMMSRAEAVEAGIISAPRGGFITHG